MSRNRVRIIAVAVEFKNGCVYIKKPTTYLSRRELDGPSLAEIEATVQELRTALKGQDAQIFVTPGKRPPVEFSKWKNENHNLFYVKATDE